MRFHTGLLNALAACALALTPIAAHAQEKTLHEERSLYRNIRVVQNGDERCMLFRARDYLGRQSCMNLSDPKHLIFDYTRMALSGLYVQPNPKRVLIVGLGGGTIPSALQELLPGAQIDVFELDEAVHQVALKYFNFVPGPHTKITIEDGRVSVKRAARANPQYDLVLLDAFEADYIPEHMLTKEFFEEIKSIMAPGGAIVANTFSSSALYSNESVTYRTVFGPFYNLKLGNRVIVAKLGGLPSMDQVRANAAQWETQLQARGTGADFLLPLFKTDVDWDTGARILTDQYSPSNVLNAKGRNYEQKE